MDLPLLELCLGLCLSAAAAFTDLDAPKAENVHWVSLDFKTILRWSVLPSSYSFTVMYSSFSDNQDWETNIDCINITDTECDLTHDLQYDNRWFTAVVMTEGSEGSDPEGLPQTSSAPFNPYKQSELSAVSFTIQKVAERSVTLNISDPLTGIHSRGKQLTIRDVLKKDLKYKVSYYKLGNTGGKKDLVVDSNLPQIPNLDPGQSYCFMVAAFVPSRVKSFQQGAWSSQTTCTSGSNILDKVELGTVFQAIFIPLVLLLVLITVVVVLCRYCRRKRKSHDTQQPPPTAQYSVV